MIQMVIDHHTLAVERASQKLEPTPRILLHNIGFNCADERGLCGGLF